MAWPWKTKRKRKGPGSSEVAAKEEEKKEGGGVEILVGTPVIEFYSIHSHSLLSFKVLRKKVKVLLLATKDNRRPRTKEDLGQKKTRKGRESWLKS